MNKEQRHTLTRIVVCAMLMVAAMLLPLKGYYRLFAFLAIYLAIGGDVLLRAVKNILRGKVFDEHFLMTVATVGAFAIGEYPEGVAVMLFYQLGEFFQDMAVGKSRRSIAALMDINPESATVIRDGAEIVVKPEEVKKGETIVIKPGEKIPLDGEIIYGASTVNTSALTGEALPRDVLVGDAVISGCVNLSGLIRVLVKSEFKESTVSKILELTENAAEKKAVAESFITRFAEVYTPCVVIAALLVAVVPPLIGGGDWSKWIEQALIFLVVSCPCALVISVPMSFFGGIGGASRHGILIKGANHLEAMAKVKAIVFDKTGTLTEGKFSVSEVYPQGISEEELLKIAAAAESYSVHPIAQSIVSAYGKEIDKTTVGEVLELPGRGVKVQISGRTVLCGNLNLMSEMGISCVGYTSVGTIVHVAVDGKYAGALVITDKVKPQSKDAISKLKALGISKTVMLTGDMKAVGESLGQELQIDEILTELMPADKVSEVERLLGEKKKGTSLAFVGDGINDAPVLSRADVGIAMGALGSDAAIEAADIVLMDDNPAKVAKALEISRKTMVIVRQNIIFALSVKALVMVLGLFGVANMWFAVFADVGVSLLAIMNAMRALKN